ncbi:MAG: Ig-like domain repeat protein [Armatimonadetes bacterium]|nr:Ig-like domain repeat protein [Armatimonadota bacterium]
MQTTKNGFKGLTQFVVICFLLIATLGVSHAAIYNVGTAVGYLAKLSDVPWGTLKPGDLVNIHYKAGGYHEIIHISQAGTQTLPIVIRGIPDPTTGALPILDGKDAIMDPHVDFRSPVFENFGVIIVSARKKNYVYGQTFPSWINIESLNIKNALYKADSSITFTDVHGKKRIFDPFGCGIYIEFAQHLTIRGCEISFNGNGIFANSKNQSAQNSADLLIEKNYIHDNGQPSIPGLSNGYHEHNIYIESDGAVYQYNRFGPLRAGCHGTMIKDRSAGTIIRYNEVVSTECSNIFAILDPQGGSNFLELKSYYPDAYVYGNVITMKASSANQSSIVWFGAYNGVSYYPIEHRGTLYFYNNTVVNHQKGSVAFELTDLPYTPTPNIYEKVDCRNNIFFTDTAVNAHPYQAFKIVITGANGTVDMGQNWISPKTTKLWLGHEGGSVVNGWANQLVGDVNGANNPGFVDLVGGNYLLTPGANSVDAGDPLAPSALALGYDVTEQYKPHQKFKGRTTLGLASDLGAYEGTAADTVVTVASVSGAIGTTKTLSAVLKHYLDGAYVANKTLTFSIGATVLGTAVTDINGKAKLAYKLPETFGVGQKALTVSFAGDASYSASKGQGTLTILAAGTTIKVSASTVRPGDSKFLVATLKRTTDNGGVSFRTLSFKIDGNVVGTADTDGTGKASLAYKGGETYAVGAHTLAVDFVGDALYSTGTDSDTLTIAQAPTKVSISSTAGKVGAKVTLKVKLTRATDSGLLDGKTVHFQVDGVDVGVAVTSAGFATLSYTVQNTLTVGIHTIGASFDGDAFYLSISGNTGVLTVKP